MRFGPLAPVALSQTINPMEGGEIVRYKVTRGDPQIPTELRETPGTGLDLNLVKLQTSLKII